MKQILYKYSRGQPGRIHQATLFHPKKENVMKRLIGTAGAVIALITCTSSAFALTPAGTTITNTAAASYTIAGAPQTAVTSTATFKVAQLVNLTVAWQDSGNIAVAPNDTGKVLTYKVTNTGNASDTFTLGINNLLSGDNFDPTAATPAIYVDSNTSGTYDSGDTATASITLAPGASQIIFLLNNIPGTVADGNTGNSQLTATSSFTPGAIGKVFTGAGTGGVDVVLGVANGSASVTGTYQVSSAVVNLSKTSAITDPYGGTSPVPGATVIYTITATMVGSGTASGVKVTDPIPLNTTYTPGTLTLAGATLTDAKDIDTGDVGGTTANTVTVTLGDITSATPAKVITFKVTIN
jgi:uncharacterized repeat protein (TIGR01451 family)